jgi:hypothetical protein
MQNDAILPIMTTRRLPVPLTDEQWELITRLADDERRSMAQQVVKIIDEWSKANPSKSGIRTKAKKS